VVPPELPVSVATLLDQSGCVRSQVLLPSSRPGRRLWRVQFTNRATTTVGSAAQLGAFTSVESVYVKQFDAAATYRREVTALGQLRGWVSIVPTGATCGTT
jgi:hypothetical protein